MKLIPLCKSKIHRATVTGADLHYEGSIGIDADLMRRADIRPFEQVCIWNINNGDRLETYAIELPAGSGQIILNGAAARHCQVGDRVIIAAFCITDEDVTPHMIAVDDENRFAGDLPAGRPREIAAVGEH